MSYRHSHPILPKPAENPDIARAPTAFLDVPDVEGGKEEREHKALSFPPYSSSPTLQSPTARIHHLHMIERPIGER